MGDIVIDASGPRMGKTHRAIQEIAERLQNTNDGFRNVVVILPMVGEPLQEEGLAQTVRDFVERSAIDHPVVGRFGRRKMCRRLADGGGGESVGGDEPFRCRVCPRKASSKREYEMGFWADQWKDLVAPERPAGCPRDQGRQLAEEDSPQVVITAAQSLTFPSESSRDQAHLTKSALVAEASALSEDRICVIDEFHNLDAFYILDDSELPRQGHDQPWSLTSIKAGLEGLQSALEWNWDDGLPADPESMMTLVQCWALCNAEIAIRTYLYHHGQDERERFQQSAVYLSWVREFERQLMGSLGSCKEASCSLCTLIQSHRGESQPWKEVLWMLSKLQAGEVVFVPRPSGQDEVKGPSELDHTSRWHFDLRLLDADRSEFPVDHRERPVLRHTVFRTIAESCHHLHLLSATPPREQTLKNALGTLFKDVKRHEPRRPDLRILVERRSLGQQALWGWDPDRWWLANSSSRFRETFLEPLVKEEEPFVIARSKWEYQQFSHQFPGYPEELIHWARGSETEGVEVDASFVLMLGPPKIPPTAEDALFYVMPWEETDAEKDHDELEVINGQMRTRSMTEALVQAAARTGTGDESAMCIVLGCHEEDVTKLESLTEEYPWFEGASMIVPWPPRSKDVLADGFKGQVPYEGRLLQARDFLEGQDHSLSLTPAERLRVEQVREQLVESVEEGSFGPTFSKTTPRGHIDGWKGHEDAYLRWLIAEGVVEQVPDGRYRIVNN